MDEEANFSPAVSIGPSERPTQIASYASLSMDTPNAVTLLENNIYYLAIISEGEGTRKKVTTASLTNRGEPTERRQQRMDW